jgi:toxin ParE1/3/4
MGRVIRAQLARQDLKDIARYLAQESRSRAVAMRVVRLIADKCLVYAREPELGESCPDLGANVRRFPVGNYVVFYRTVHNGIQLLRVLHGSRDIPAAWRSG